MTTATLADQPLIIIYDGECPFCQAYVKMLRLKQTFGNVHLISARESDDPIVSTLKAQGVQFDRGIVVQWQGRILQADEAMHFLSQSSTPSTLFNRFNIWLFQHPQVAKAIYPFLYAGRNTALFFLNHKRIAQ